jgi:alkylated DNA repair dioxygenase AlkB
MNANSVEIRRFHEDKVSNLLPNDGTVYYYGKILNSREANQNFDLLMKNILWQNDEVIIFGKHIITKRKAAWYGDSDYLYTYSNSTKLALPWTDELSWLKQTVEELVGTKFNSCLLNLYHNGKEGMGWHSDDEKSLGKNNTIASLSLGAERKFLFKHKRVLNTILYNRKEETKDEVRKRKGNIPTAAPSTAITSEPSISNNVSAVSSNDPLFDRKIELVTEGLDPFFGSKLRELLEDNALTIINYILSMKNEINLSDGYRKLNIYVFYSVSRFFNNRKTYKKLTRDDIMQFLESLRKPVESDPLHKWIGTYNIYRVLLIRFFKWLYYPNMDQKKRPKPGVIDT